MNENIDIVRLNIQLTKKCNQRCISCNSYELDSNNELTEDNIKKIIVGVTSRFKIKNIAFTGGEPTTVPYILDIVKFARMHCEKVSITTNGFYCNSEENINKLIKAGINRFSFSYHGVGVHDSFTGVEGSEQRIRNAISIISSMKEKGIYCKIGTLFTGNNIDSIERVLEYAEQVGVDLYIELLDNQLGLFSDSLLNKNNVINKEVVLNSINKIRKWKDDNRPILMDEKGLYFIEKWFNNRKGTEKLTGECPLYKTDIYIDSKGNVYSGCWVLESVGNILFSDIETIIKSNNYMNNIEKMKNRACSGCTCGYLMQAKYLL